MEHRSIQKHMARLSPQIVKATLALAAISFAWTASGTVKSVGGELLSGVTVVRNDSTTHRTTTDASGAFKLEATSGIQDRFFQNQSSLVRIEGNELVVQVPADGPVHLALLDASGRESWSASSVASNGAARISTPVGVGRQALWLRVSHARGSFEQAALITGDGLRIAKHIAAARAFATFPVLKFSKSGYRDTTYAMTSETATNLSIVMAAEGGTTTCPTTKLAPVDFVDKTITIKGVSRTYRLHVPTTYKGDTPVPLLVDYHPIGGTAAGQFGGTLYKSQADKDGAISVYPEGLESPLSFGATKAKAWNVKGCCTTADDTAFARALVAEIKKIACIDPKRVYAAGFSMGGGMTHFSACHLADIFAAAAPAAFDLLKENVDICKPVRPITMVMFRGTKDGTVPYEPTYSAVVPGMAINFLGAKETAAKWAELNKCTGSPSAEDSKGCSTYSNCAGGVQVTLCTKQGGQHDQGDGSVGWPILKKYTLP
ncbi:MAG: hypothetical protein RL173_633 [Fibrobacterota bacterium]|jgi:polyhydroxybutyrate depolymerase